MNLFNDQHVPSMGAPQNKQRMLIFVLIGMVVLGIILMLLTFVFNNDPFANQINKAVASQERTQQVAELILENSSGATANFAITVEAVAATNAIELKEYRTQKAGGGNSAAVEIASERQSIEAAAISGSTDAVAAELLSQNLQAGLQEVQELTSLTNNQQFKSDLGEMREDIAALLAELEDGQI